MTDPMARTATKVCTACDQHLPIDKFSVNRTCADRRSTICKTCFAAKYGRKQDEFRKTDEGRALRRAQRRNRPVTESARKRERKHTARYRGAYPEKEQAKRAVRSAIQSGTLLRPSHCEVCGEAPGLDRAGRPRVQAHHPDYSKPLRVQWLCPLCHAAEHRALKGANP